MALSISLSNDDGRPYTPGSMVLGVVRLDTFEDQTIGSLTITFSGQTKVLLNQNYGDLTVSRTDYYSCGYLFSRHLSLYQGKYTHHKGTYAWPFAFRIPLFAAPRAIAPGSKELFERRPPWKGDRGPEPHPLPPSMFYRGRFTSSVEYVLQAILAQPSASPMALNKNLIALKTIPVHTLAISPTLSSEDDWPYINHRHVVKCPLASASQTVTSRIFSKFYRGKGNVPEVELWLCVLLPKKIEIKAQAALSILVSATAQRCIPETPRQDRGGNILNSHAKLTITSFKLSLVQRTQVRAGCHSPSSERQIFTRKGSCSVPVSQSPSTTSSTEPSNPEARTTEATFVNLGDSADLSVPIASLVPDFSTYNIARSHTLDLALNVEYERKRFKFILRTVPIRILPRSGSDLERRLSQSLALDDEYGCEQRSGQGRVNSGIQSLRQGQGEESWVVPPPEAPNADNIADADTCGVPSDAIFAEPLPVYTVQA
ncbi:uncharacterized protein Z518_02702 [Rhinocladiella mackenziei CBS 650.93]|uniref:Arrestin-like N-terminal domain-containing protein n=1 Tax=Rhinocladiella mackenziei CBS 650.93 TaxID=1442369 RepID=A0A0D2G0M6_9EURO|nr:uncharacterized protein Z518_02702 [Rhinocladiella mackenziei CBS 650.93]KIX08047.1 hypothetical protein Z518_02702 [Rhinocladiella mackenziei CBS 650.93]